ncbi:MAG: C10 family peptidase [Bacteroidota bacterium]
MTSVSVEKDNDQPCYYTFVFDHQGFVIVSADDAAYPIIGYSFESSFDLNNQPETFLYWMNKKKNEIISIRKNSIAADQRIADAWKQLDNKIVSEMKAGTSGGPLLPCNWDQGGHYNALCPEDQFGPSGHALVGCVATAMAMIMYYYRYPEHGIGSSSYFSDYGTLSVDYSAATYDWNSMTNSLTGPNDEVAEIGYHCGVSVEMMYGANGSGAYMWDVPPAIISHFGYSSDAVLLHKDDFSEVEWDSILIENIDNGWPIDYAGFDAGGNGGHSWVCDGYQGTDFFHMNWGWGGSSNGFFYLNALTASGYNFIDGEQAVVNFHPDMASYPNYCIGNSTFQSLTGTFADGSGNLDYTAGANCSWLIDPQDNVDYITLNFSSFKTEYLHDFVTVYDGPNASSPVIGTFSGDTMPTQIQSTGDKMFVTFTSDASGSADGFLATYKCVLPVYCSGIDTLTMNSAVFDDGSGVYNYNINSNCKWFICPPGAPGLAIHFNNFETEGGADYLKIYNSLTNPPALLGSFTGNTVPSDIFTLSNKVMLIFHSNSSNNFQGWEVSYNIYNGIDESGSLSSVMVYPNPAQNSVQVNIQEHADLPVMLEIVDMTGKVIYQYEMHSIEHAVDVSSFCKGLYILRLTGKSSVNTIKISIK